MESMSANGAIKMALEGDQYFYGHGKLLLSGEYFVLDGAKSLVLPTKFGQSMSVKYNTNYDPHLYWKSYDFAGQVWFETKFEFWHFDILGNDDPSAEELMLQKILRQARVQNNHFLRDEVDVHVETNLSFPIEWGLGSSSTLLYNIAQWAYISPFQLLFKTYGGSGYDIACAQSDGPITYAKKTNGPSWGPIQFNPSFKDQIYFIYLGNKQNSQTAIADYYTKRPFSSELIETLSEITDQLLSTDSIDRFEELIRIHEGLVAKNLNLTRVKDLHFSDYWGGVKSLGAWGGDFIMVTSKKSKALTKKYFSDKGYDIFFPFDKIILENPEAKMTTQTGQRMSASVH